jgi:hypothetical protein
LHVASPKAESPQHNGLMRVSQELAALRDFHAGSVGFGVIFNRGYGAWQAG